MKNVQIIETENIEVMDREDYKEIMGRIEDLENGMPNIDDSDILRRLEVIERKLGIENLKLCEIDTMYKQKRKS